MKGSVWAMRPSARPMEKSHIENLVACSPAPETLGQLAPAAAIGGYM